jgi:hypothetical protein
LQPTRQFEPASAIKAVMNLAVMRRVQAGTDSLSSPFTYYNYPNGGTFANTKDACTVGTDEIAANVRSSTLDAGKDRMMSVSDNPTTRGVILRYGLQAIRDTARLTAGMSSTTINQDHPGCGWSEGKKNETTLTDLGRLYEGVENGSLLGTGSFRTEFYQPMSGGGFGGNPLEDSIVKVVNEEAALQQKSDIATSFAQGMQWRLKGGSYDIGCPQTGCSTGLLYFRSQAGRLTLPVKTTPTTFGTRTYVFGRYVDSLNLGCSGCSTATTADNQLALVDKELFREIIASALLTW